MYNRKILFSVFLFWVCGFIFADTLLVNVSHWDNGHAFKEKIDMKAWIINDGSLDGTTSSVESVCYTKKDNFTIRLFKNEDEHWISKNYGLRYKIGNGGWNETLWGNDGDGETTDIPVSAGQSITMEIYTLAIKYYSIGPAITRTFIQDTTPPSITITRDDIEGEWYNGQDRVTLTAEYNENSDESGLASTDTETKYVNKNGKTPVSFDVYDNVGNHNSKNYIVKIDRESPNLIANSSTITIDNSNPNQYKLRYNWEPVTDLPEGIPETDNSGVAGYYLYLDNAEYQILASNENQTEFSNTYKEINLQTESEGSDITSNIIRNITYNPSMFVTDTAKNRNKGTELEPFCIPSKVKIQELYYKDKNINPPVYINGRVEYPYLLSVDLSDQVIDPDLGIKELRLYCVDLDNKKTLLETINISDGLPTPDPENTGRYNFDYALKSNIHAHKPYVFELETVHRYNTINNVPFTEIQQKVMEEVPNYKGDLDLTSSEPNLVNEKEVDPGTYEIGINTILPGGNLDYEDDTVKYRLFSNFHYPVSGWNEAGTMVSLIFPSPGDYNINADIRESNGKEGNEKWESSSYQSFPTSKILKIREGQEKIIETKAQLPYTINEWYSVSGTKPARVITENNQSFIELQVKLQNSDDSYLENYSVFDFDIDRFINYLVNDKKLVFPSEVFSDGEIDILKFLKKSNILILRDAIEKNKNDEDKTLIRIIDQDSNGVYKFPYSNETYKLVIVAEGDSSSPTYYSKIVKIDNIPPSPLSMENLQYFYPQSYELDGGSPNTSISFEIHDIPDNDIKYYTVKYDDIEACFSEGNEASIPLDNFNYNEELQFELRGYDEAGNRTLEAKSFTYYSPSWLPTESCIRNDNNTIVFDSGLDGESFASGTLKVLYNKIEIPSEIVDNRLVFNLPVNTKYNLAEYTVVSQNSSGIGFSRVFNIQGIHIDPVISIDSSIEDKIYGKNEFIDFTVSDPDDTFSITCLLNGEDISGDIIHDPSTYGKCSINLVQFNLTGDDNHTLNISVKASDPGNTTVPRDIVFKYDDTAPSGEFTDLTEGVVTNKNAFSIGYRDNLELDSVDVTGNGKNIFSKTDFSGETTDTVSLGNVPDGNYELMLTIVDKGGNKFTLPLSMVLDRSDPVLGDNSIILDSGYFAMDSYYAPGSLGFNVTVGDSNLEYLEIEQLSNGDVVDSKIIRNSFSGTSNIVSGSISKCLAIKNGGFTILRFIAVDSAGNRTVNEFRDRIVWDTTSPVATITELRGRVPGYFSKLSDIGVDFDSSDKESGILENQYGVRESGSPSDYTWSDTVSGLILSPVQNRGYEFTVKSTNNCGLATIAVPFKLVYDARKPVLGSLDIIYPNGALGQKSIASGDLLTLGINPDTASSYIDYYELKIGNTIDPVVISNNIDGNKSGVLTWTSGNGTFMLPEVENGSYKINVRAFNRYGESVSTTGNFIVNNDIERISVNGIGSVLSMENIGISLEYRGSFQPGAEYQWLLYSGSDNLLINGTSSSTTINLDSNTLGLVNGERYYFQFVTTNSNNEPVKSNSTTFLFDITKPVISINEIPSYSRNLDLYLGITAEEDASGIGRIEYRIEKIGTDGIFTKVTPDWKKCPVDGGVNTISERLELGNNSLKTDDRIRIAVRAINTGSLVSDYKYSGLIIIDNEHPVSPVIADEGDYCNLSDGLNFNYVYSETSRLERIGEASYALLWGSYNTENALWNNFDKSESGSFGFIYTEDEKKGLNGKTAILAVRTINKNGLEVIGYSNGIKVDTDAPDILKVDLYNNTHNNLTYIQSFNDISFAVSGRDNSSLDMIYYNPGVYENGEWTPVDNTGEKSVPYTSNRIQYSGNIVDDNYNGEIISLKTEVSDEARNISQPGYSGLIKMVVDPVVELSSPSGWIASIETRECLYFSWKIDTNIPIADLAVTLEKEGADTARIPDYIDNSKAYFFSDSFDDGNYTIKLDVKDVFQTNYNMVSNTIVLDNSGPELNDIKVSSFAAEDIIYSVTVDENLSAIDEVYYAVGNQSDPLAVTGNWVLMGENFDPPYHVEFLNETIFLNRGQLVEGNKLYLSFQTVNSRGIVNQKKVMTPVLIDLSTPEIVFSEVPEYTRTSTGIGIAGKGKLEIDISDNLSGLDYYQYALSTEKNSPEDNLEWNTVHFPESSDLTYGSLVKSLDCNLEDSSEYYIYTRAVNGARETSPVFESSFVRTDFTKPEISFNLVPDRIDSSGRYVVNDVNTYDIPFGYLDNSLDKWNDSKVFVTGITVETEDGFPQHNYINDSDWAGDSFKVDVVDQDQRRNYTVVVSSADEAGNTNESVLDIRFNLAPNVTPDPENCLYTGNNIFIPTTPGKPINLVNYLLYGDTEGYPLESYSFDLKGAARSPDDLDEIEDNGDNPVAYVHTDPENNTYTDYTLEVVATDSFGKASSPQILGVRVRNTERGILFTDEYWQDGHRITGDIRAGSGIKLVVVENAEVVAQEIDGECGFTVFVAGELILEDGSYIHKEGDDGHYWGGIVLKNKDSGSEPKALINGSKIGFAQRGLTIVDGVDITLENTTFEDNEIGLHLVGGTYDFFNLTFRGSKQYGAKEDDGANPEFKSCSFMDNLYDYYDEQRTGIDYVELNGFGGNEGNEGN